MNNLLAHNFLPYFIAGIDANRCRFFYGQLSCLVDIVIDNEARLFSGHYDDLLSIYFKVYIIRFKDLQHF